MINKLFYLIGQSLKKKLKTKWFIIANIIFLLLIVGLINIDSIVTFFGGDFEEKQEILVIDELNLFDELNETFIEYTKYIDNYTNTELIKSDLTYELAIKEVEDNDKILLLITKDDDNYLKAKTISNQKIGTITSTILTNILSNIRSEKILEKYQIDPIIMQDINKGIIIENEILSDKNDDDNFTIATIMEILTLPIFFLITYLVQMIGAEVNEEKSTRSMEIIISNVSPKIHFLSKIISSNVFVIFQGALIIIYGIIGIGLRIATTGNDIFSGLGEFGEEINMIINTSSISSITSTFSYAIPIYLIIIILTFVAYSLFAGILASMTTSMEDFQQLQTPVIIILIVSYYLSFMSSMFEGSTFIKIMSYIPFLSTMLAPSLYIMGQITIIDLGIAIILLIGTIYLLIKYGTRIYKVGILNYSQSHPWKKMFNALRGK